MKLDLTAHDIPQEDRNETCVESQEVSNGNVFSENILPQVENIVSVVAKHENVWLPIS